MEYLNFFTSEKIDDRLYIITEGYSMIHRMTLGLVLGDEKNMLIDTGMAMTDDLRRVAARIAGNEKPMICVCTHLHPDHISGAILLDEAYCSHFDYPKNAAFSFSASERIGDLEELCLHNEEVKAYCGRHMVQKTERYFEDVKDGDIFDLGGITVEAIGMPGHTEGSMAFYIPSLGHVFTGDAVNTDTHLTRMGRPEYAAYRDTLRRFISIVSDDVVLHPAHMYLPMDISVAKNLAQACDDIANGRVANDPPGDTMFAYRNLKKPNTPDMYIHYVGNTGVTYDLKRTENAPHTGIYNFYSHEQVAENIYIVTENFSVVHHFTIGVITGPENTIVIDAGMGMSEGLREHIESFAGKDNPILCLLTNGSMEHIGGMSQFDRVYLSAGDQDLIRTSADPEKRFSALCDYALYEPRTEQYCKEHMLKADGLIPEEVHDGDTFTTGVVSVRVLSFPGCTPGSMLYIIPERNIVFTGDAVNVFTNLEKLTSQEIGAYADRLEQLIKIVGEETTFFAFHTNRPQKVDIIKKLTLACREVSTGLTEGDPPGETIFGKGENKHSRRLHYHNNCCIIYKIPTNL